MEKLSIGSKWDEVLEEANKKILESCKEDINLANEIQIMKFIFDNPEIQELTNKFLQDLKPFMRKSNEISKKIREEGNQIYKSNKTMFQCVVIYTGALMSSEPESLEMAFAHSNRAASLMKLEFYEEALIDTEMAIKYNHTDLFKMYERKCECSLIMRSKEKLKQNVKKLQKIFESKPNNQKLHSVEKYKMYLEAFDDIKPETVNQKNEMKLPKDTVKMMCNDKSGRFVITKRKIKKDEPIFVETPFAFVPVHDGSKRITNVDCENCGITNIIPFPCSICGRASYCDPKCLEEHAAIHKYECQGYKTNLWYQIGIAHLSLRTMLTGIPVLIKKIKSFDIKEFKNQPEKIFKHLEDLCSEKYNNYFEEGADTDEFIQYGQVFGLSTNFFKKDMLISKTLYYAITSSLITSYLQNNSTFFDDYMDENIMTKEDWKLFISGVLLRHVGQLIINGHAIVDFRQSIYQMDSLDLLLTKNVIICGGLHEFFRSERIFTGIFPKISMLNHSCEPNIRNVFEKNQLTIYATRDLKENDEVFNCYGPNFKLMSYKERQGCLKLQYNFECTCEKCLEKNDEHRSNNSATCKSCGHRILYPDIDPTVTECIPQLKCSECDTVYENNQVKEFFQLFMDENNKAEMGDAYALYQEAIKDFGDLDEVKLNMMSMLLKTFIRNSEHINFFNEQIPHEMSIDLMNAKAKLYGVKSVEFIESSFFYLDLMAITKLMEKSLLKLDMTLMEKIKGSLSILSSRTREIVETYIEEYIRD